MALKLPTCKQPHLLILLCWLTQADHWCITRFIEIILKWCFSLQIPLGIKESTEISIHLWIYELFFYLIRTIRCQVVWQIINGKDCIQPMSTPRHKEPSRSISGRLIQNNGSLNQKIIPGIVCCVWQVLLIHVYVSASTCRLAGRHYRAKTPIIRISQNRFFKGSSEILIF